MFGERFRSGHHRVLLAVAGVIALLAATVGFLISLDVDHELGTVVQPSDLAGIGLPWRHSSPDDCALVGCLDGGLVIGLRAVQLDTTDLAFASTVFRGSVNRTYRSDLVGGSAPAHALMFGTGWMTVLDSRLILGPAMAELTTPPTADGVVEIGRLDGTLTALWGSGELWQFDEGGRLRRIESPTGRYLDVNWDGDAISAVAVDGGQGFEMATSDNGRVTAVTSSDGRTVEYQYDNGRLVGVAGPAGAERYTYDATGRLKLASMAAGRTEIAYDGTGLVSRFTVDGGAPLDVSGASPAVVVNDVGRDVTSVYEFDSAGRLVRGEAEGEEILTRSFDDSGRLVRSDAPGEHLELSYGSDGQLSRVVENGEATLFSHDDLGRTVQVETADGAVTTYGYGGRSTAPASVTDPLGGVVRFGYRDGRVSEVTDADGVTETHSYDGAGNLVGISDESGGTTSFAYDPAGRLVGRETPEGIRSAAAFDDAGRVRELSDGPGAQTLLGYNPSGQPQQVVSPAGRSSFEYDGAGRLTAETGPTGSRVFYGYDGGELTGLGVAPSGDGDPVEVDVAGGDGGPLSVYGPGGDTEVVASSEGQATEIDLPDGRHQSLRYDTGGRLVSVALDGTVAATYRYDPVGRLVASGNADGLVEERSYDLAGRLTGIVRPDGSVWAATWTPAGRIESVTDPEGRRTSWSYDDTGRVAKMGSPGGATVEVEHDADGRVTALTENGGVRWSYRYDTGGRLVSADTPAGPVDYQWDSAGRLVARVDSGGDATRWRYDDQGRLENVKIPGGDNDLDWRYDGFGNVTSWEDGDDRWEVERDTNGRPLRIDAPSGDRHGDYSIEWDDAGNPTVFRYGDTTEELDYDPLGRVTTATYGDDIFDVHLDGAVTTITESGGGDPVVEYQRDALGRLNRVWWGDSDDEQALAEWDDAGRPVMLSNGDHEIRVARDQDSRPTRVDLDGDTALTAEYTDGQPASVSTEGNVLSLGYDDGHVTEARSGDVSVDFDADGRPETFETGGDDGGFAYSDDGTLSEFRFGEDRTTAAPTPDGLDADGGDGDLLESLFEDDGTYRGLPGADPVPEFSYLSGVPPEFQPADLAPTAPESQAEQAIASIDTAVPQPLKLEESPHDIAEESAEAILSTPLDLAVHPARVAHLTLFDENSQPAELTPADDPVWAGLLSGLGDRHDSTGTFDWITSHVTGVAHWAGTAASTVVRGFINAVTDPRAILAGIAQAGLTAACVAAAPVCPAVAFGVVLDTLFLLLPAGLAALTTDRGLADIALDTVATVAFAAASGYLLGRALRPLIREYGLNTTLGCRFTRVVCYSESRFPETGTAYRDLLGPRGSTVLTPDSSLAAANRRAALNDTPTLLGFDRDEFPFAATRQGGAGATVTYVNPSENRAAGAWIGQQFRAVNGGSILFTIVP